MLIMTLIHVQCKGFYVYGEDRETEVERKQ